MGNKTWLVVLCFCCLTVSVPQVVRACSGVLYCPRSLTVPPSGGRLPANMQMFLWRAPCGDDGISAFHPELEATSPGGSKRVVDVHLEPAAMSVGAHRWVVRWDEPFEPGTELFFSFDEPLDLEVPRKDAGTHAMQRRAVELRVIEAAERPEELGRLLPTRAFGAFALASGDADCSHFVQAAYVDLQLVEPLANAPWAGAIVYETRVDSKRWSPYRWHSLQGESDSWLGGSTLGRSSDRIHLPCALPAHPSWLFERIRGVLEPGEHTATMVGFLPDGSEISSRPYTFTLECPAELPDAGITEFLSPEQVKAESQRAADAGTGQSAAVSGGGCSAAPAATRGHGAGWLALLPVLALLRLRSRQRE
jgi:hypothetical protein